MKYKKGDNIIVSYKNSSYRCKVTGIPLETYVLIEMREKRLKRLLEGYR